MMATQIGLHVELIIGSASSVEQTAPGKAKLVVRCGGYERRDPFVSA
jgi:hypothetical protein